MMSSRSSIVALLICWSMISGMKTEGITQREADFAVIVNGIWDNKDQVQEASGFDFLQVHLKPVDIPVLRPATVVYVEEAINGIVNAINLAVVTEGPDGNIYLKRYNISHQPGLKFGSFNLDDLANVTLKDLDSYTYKNCTSEFEQTESRIFVGEWEACDFIVNDQHPKYTLIYTCTHHVASIPLNIKEVSTRLSYKLERIGKRYSLLQVPDNYVSPCAGLD